MLLNAFILRVRFIYYSYTKSKVFKLGGNHSLYIMIQCYKNVRGQHKMNPWVASSEPGLYKEFRN
jgi:hypothetical protein